MRAILINVFNRKTVEIDLPEIQKSFNKKVKSLLGAQRFSSISFQIEAGIKFSVLHDADWKDSPCFYCEKLTRLDVYVTFNGNAIVIGYDSEKKNFNDLSINCTPEFLAPIWVEKYEIEKG